MFNRASKTPAFKTHRCLSPSRKTLVKKADLLTYHRQMLRIRKMETEIDKIYKSGLVRGFCHLSDGQEAVAVGMEAALRPSDHLITAYRCHGQQLMRGDSLRAIFAELMGRASGSSRGKGGSMHLYLPRRNFYGGNGIVGAQVPVGGGIALACQRAGRGQVAVAMFGDGAANQGQVFETANMAALMKLPLIFLVENNGYGMGTSTTRSSACDAYYTRGDYVPGVLADGLDVVAMREATAFCAEHCRAGRGPIFLEALTYRYHGHSMSDPGKSYRAREEVREVRRERDAIKRAAGAVVERGWATEGDLKAVEKGVAAEVSAELEAAKGDREGDPLERFRDVYYEEEMAYVRGTDKEQSWVSE